MEMITPKDEPTTLDDQQHFPPAPPLAAAADDAANSATPTATVGINYAATAAPPPATPPATAATPAATGTAVPGSMAAGSSAFASHSISAGSPAFLSDRTVVLALSCDPTEGRRCRSLLISPTIPIPTSNSSAAAYTNSSNNNGGLNSSISNGHIFDAATSSDPLGSIGRKRKKKHAIQRVWSKESEAMLLTALLKVKDLNGASPIGGGKDLFYDYLTKQMGEDFKFSKEQLQRKVWKLKEKYMTKARKAQKNDRLPKFATPHDEKSFEMSGKIWDDEIMGRIPFRKPIRFPPPQPLQPPVTPCSASKPSTIRRENEGGAFVGDGGENQMNVDESWIEKKVLEDGLEKVDMKTKRNLRIAILEARKRRLECEVELTNLAIAAILAEDVEEKGV